MRKRAWWTLIKRSALVGSGAVFLIGVLDALSHSQVVSAGPALMAGVVVAVAFAVGTKTSGWWKGKLGWAEKKAGAGGSGGR
jgi:hypothetical protein